MQCSSASEVLAEPQVRNAVVSPGSRLPRLPSDAIARPRLTERILDGIHGPLALVCAPAGFGKTIALASAMEGIHWPVAWLSLESDDSSLPQFIRYLAASLEQH